MLNTKNVMRIASQFSEKMSGETRGDMFLSDWEKTGKNSAKVLVGWSKSLALPRNEEFDHFILSSFDSKLGVEFKTLRIYPRLNLASFIVKELVPSRNLGDVKSMVKVGPGRYLEAQALTGDQNKRVWEVSENEGGDKFLTLVRESNIEELLEEKRGSIKWRKAEVPTFQVVAQEQANFVIEPGDGVRFYHRGILKEGTIKSIKPDGTIFIKTAAGQAIELQNESPIVDLFHKGPATGDDQKERVKEYWTKVYGKEYVDKWLSYKKS